MTIFAWFKEKKEQWFHTRPPVIGLALSGGATRGAAHIGVLQVLAREGIHPDIIAGNSAGAIVGAGYAAGVPVDTLSAMFRQLDWSSLVRPALRERLGVFHTRPMEAFIEAHIGKKTFEELPCRLAVVACDLLTGERVVLDKGSVAKAVRASSAVPGVFTPVDLDGHLLVDGGVVDNFPVALALEMGADYVIGVDVSFTNLLGHRPKNPVQVLFAAMSIRSRRSLPDPSLVNCLIKPDISAYAGWDFEHAAEMEAAGRYAAEQALPQLKADLGLL